jgi:ATP-dependent Clp protease ATP-binding subunit ClpA
MSENPRKIMWEQNFLEVLINAQFEANRFGIEWISDILVLKELVYMSSSNMSELLSCAGIPWFKIKASIEKEVNNWAKRTKMDVEKYGVMSLNNNAANEKKADFVIDPQLAIILEKSTQFLYDDAFLDEVAFVLGLMQAPSGFVTSFFKTIKLDSEIIIRFYEGILYEESYDDYDIKDEKTAKQDKSIERKNQTSKKSEENSEFVIPSNLRSFLKVMKAEISETSPILGREEETEKLIRILLKVKKSNAIMVGKPGVGKTAIAEDLAWRIKNGKCPEALKNKIILELSVNNIVAGTDYRGTAEERFKQISEFLEEYKEVVILFIDETHNVVGAGSINHEGTQDLANALKPILAREGISVIGATTEEEYERVFKNDGAFKRRFAVIPIREPKSSEVYPMVKEQVRRLSQKHGITITKPVVEYIIKVSGCFNFKTANPDRTLDLVDESMAAAKLKGEKTVTRKTVLKNFDANFKLYSKMSEERKISLAYHETGHYLVAKYGKHFPLKAMAVSIIPADSYLGVTVYDDERVLLDEDYDFFIDSISRSLGGRVAEKMYTGKETASARSDLEQATEEARSMIVEYGMSSKFAFRNCDNDFYDEKSKKLDEEIDKIIKEAYKNAERILIEHENALTAIVSELLKKGILIADDLDRICKKTEGRTLQITETETAEVK